MISKVLIFAIFFLLTSVMPTLGDRSIQRTSSNTSEKRLALVIGNSKYINSPLKNPANDAQDIARALKQNGFQVTLLKDSGQQEMEKAIRKFGKRLGSFRVGLFYFAGHGIQHNGRNYLIPVDARIESESDLKFEAVDAGRVLGKMEDAGNDVNIVILDACRNNPFARSFRSGDQGLARMDAPTGSLVAYATAPGSVAADGTGRNGVYTKYLLKYINQPGLSINKLFMQVRKGVLSDTARKQTPWESSSLTGDFIFDISTAKEMNQQSQSADLTAEKRPYPALIDPEEEFWQALKGSTKADDFQLYINTYPNGRFRSVAELRLSQLTRPSESDHRPRESLMKGWWGTWQVGKSSSKQKLDAVGNRIWQYTLSEKDSGALAGCNLSGKSISIQGNQIQIRLHSLEKNPVWI